MRYILISLAILAAVPAWADDSPQEMLAKDKIQFGQLLIQLGNAELEAIKLKKENDDLKSAAEKSHGHP